MVVQNYMNADIEIANKRTPKLYKRIEMPLRVKKPKYANSLAYKDISKAWNFSNVAAKCVVGVWVLKALYLLALWGVCSVRHAILLTYDIDIRSVRHDIWMIL